MRILFVIGMAALMGIQAGELQIDLVSKPMRPAARAMGESLGLILNGNATVGVFSSQAGDLVPNFAANGSLNVYVMDFSTGSIALVSKGVSGGTANGDSVVTSISDDGRYIVFESDATDLIAADTNDAVDIFLYDRITKEMELVSAQTSGQTDSTGAVLSGNGRFVVFETGATPTNLHTTLRLYDRFNGSKEVVANSTGSLEPSISFDGRFISFVGRVGVNGELLPSGQAFLYDTFSDETTWLSKTSQAGPSTNVSSAVVSRDGSTVAFLSAALEVDNNQDPTNAAAKRIHLYATGTGAMEMLPLPALEAAEIRLRLPEFSISSNGGVVAYSVESFGTNGWPKQARVYVTERGSGEQRKIDFPSGSELKLTSSHSPIVTDDGNSVAFLGRVFKIEISE